MNAHLQRLRQRFVQWHGIASELIATVTTWCESKGANRINYNTAKHNVKLISLMEFHGFVSTLDAGDMVQLTKSTSGELIGQETLVKT